MCVCVCARAREKLHVHYKERQAQVKATQIPDATSYAKIAQNNCWTKNSLYVHPRTEDFRTEDHPMRQRIKVCKRTQKDHGKWTGEDTQTDLPQNAEKDGRASKCEKNGLQGLQKKAVSQEVRLLACANNELLEGSERMSCRCTHHRHRAFGHLPRTALVQMTAFSHLQITAYRHKQIIASGHLPGTALVQMTARLRCSPRTRHPPAERRASRNTKEMS